MRSPLASAVAWLSDMALAGDPMYDAPCIGDPCSERAEGGCDVCKLSVDMLEDVLDGQLPSAVHAVFGADDDRERLLLSGIVNGGMVNTRLEFRRDAD